MKKNDNNSLSKHFTQTFTQDTSYFMEHTNIFQQVKNFLWVYGPEKVKT